MNDHHMGWDTETTEYVDANGWVVREPNGVITVTCSCGLTAGPIGKAEGIRIGREHAAAVGLPSYSIDAKTVPTKS